MARKDRFARMLLRRRGTALAAALAALALLASARVATAQPTVEVPGVSGDQLIFFYDARTGRVPFLSIANPASAEVVVEVAFYPATLASRLGAQSYTIPAGGNVVVDPTQSSVAGSAASGNAGIAVVTPVAGTGSTQAVVPPQPLTGGYTLANVELAAAFGENPYGRLAVGGNGQRAAAGTNVDGDAVRYQRFTPTALMAPVYYNPSTLAPPESDGNRVVLLAFNDSYGAQFDVTAATDEVAALFCDADGFEAAVGSASVNGVLLSNLQELAGGATLASSGKLFLDVNPGSGNVIGIFSQSLGTFAAGQRMPAVATVPDCPMRVGPTPTQPTPTRTPSGTPDGGSSATCTGGRVSLTVDAEYDTAGGAIEISGLAPMISYPSALSIPGSGSDQSVVQRITNLTGIGDALFQIFDDDALMTINVGLVSLSAPIPPGPYARVQFDCTDGALIQTSQFSCPPFEVVEDIGTVYEGTCSLSLSAP